MRQHSVTFANFICRFGKEKVLLDYIEEIVIPAFTRDTYVRSYGQHTHYYFYNVELVRLDEIGDIPILGLAGQFVKDTELTRHQVLDEEQGLVHDEQTLQSSPSAFFVLVLNHHRLVYLPETPYAPDFVSFEATAKRFLRNRHKEYISELYSRSRNANSRVTKKALYEEHPSPTLDVIPLTGQDDIREFLGQYKTLKRIEFRLVRPRSCTHKVFRDLRRCDSSSQPQGVWRWAATI
ncbi:MAG: hypothetical protein OXE57_20330 [Alphaproteobacteria bacterium]|nr:hypothetical protein [Alphaproteobacteria bacterium]